MTVEPAFCDDPDVQRLAAEQQAEIGDGVAEVKRMYAVPAARGRGVAKAVLAGLEDAARRRGWTTLRLETGPRQPEAVALYAGAGYRPIAAFGGYGARRTPRTRCSSSACSLLADLVVELGR